MTSRHSHLSIRTACDRCRSQKLRCSLATQASDDESRQCTRCQRAKTDCVFSRRRRLGDSYKAIPEQARQTLQSSSLPSVDSPFWLWGYQDGSLTDTTSNPDMFPQLSTLFTESNAESLGHEWMEMGSRHYIDLLLSPHPSANKPEENHDGAVTRLASSTTASSAVHNPHSTASESCSSSTPAPIVQQILQLIADIQRTLDTLAKSHWASQESQVNIQEYPVGSVLSLANAFERLLWYFQRPARKDSAEIPPREMCESHGHRQYPTLSASDQRAVTREDGSFTDTSTILLLLSGYLQPENLLTLVLTQFENFLRREDDTPLGRNTTAAVRKTERLRLGDLSSAYEGYSKILLAVQLLLDAFQPIESLLGLPESLQNVQRGEAAAYNGQGPRQAEPACCIFESKLTQYILLQRNGQDAGNHGLLSAKAHWLRMLLRDRMSLGWHNGAANARGGTLD
ncbi:hypothetical protein N7491_007857 [Penicillium cf. griseofulvum]|uniref:Zn(2)-C6 fungal-type domain-containing protein n=1 Tax=Penicillium cf. griseofulvum TaxID=2972120 RepID=A0A9W9J490_9EURO|nr:hypothetical protein N7472_009114 [Penicillium cf. griseofulvum]KAJ5427415.1 hypothetical protein N7491_007857 [Penicillium cf. griseofulvum]